MVVQKRLGARTYLTFQLGEEVFAADVSNVHKVLDFTPVTKIPGTPDFMRGIINLRGRAVPVVDLRLKFGMAETEQTLSTCIIVMNIGMGGGNAVIGALADSVRDVFEFDPGEIEPPPRFGATTKTDYIQGIGKREEQFVIILDFNRIFSTDDVVMLTTAGELAPESEDEVSEEERGREEKCLDSL